MIVSGLGLLRSFHLKRSSFCYLNGDHGRSVYEEALDGAFTMLGTVQWCGVPLRRAAKSPFPAAIEDLTPIVIRHVSECLENPAS